MRTTYRPLSLPRVPRSQQLTVNLIPDPITPNAHALLATPISFPSLLRRSRQVRDGAHFSYVSPLPLSFPYDIKVDPQEDESMQVESYFRALELPTPPAGTSRCQAIAAARQRTATYPSARLVAFSPPTHEAYLPHLDVGDAYTWIQSTSGTPTAYSSGPALATEGDAHMWGTASADPAMARQALSDWASGRAYSVDIEEGVRVRDDDGTGAAFLVRDEEAAANTKNALAALYQRTSYGPWSLRYGGHQFGEWAGQLGDGRAVSLLETLHPDTQARCEVQLKGAGRTPYSRFADGLATLKSSVREFLASEYMAALGIPTSRALCVVALPDVPVERETRTSAAVTMRLATSWLRIGNFEIHARRQEWESVRVLGEFVARDLFGWDDVVKGESSASRPPWAKRLVYEVARRNAKTVALWQVYGFMHGVINTDNMALTGETIDYGPYGFMDVFDEHRACNHSDWMHRYSYEKQPTMLLYAIDRLCDALAPIWGWERAHNQAPSPGEWGALPENERQMYADQLDDEREALQTWLRETILEEWAAGWCRRLGVAMTTPTHVKDELVDPLLDAIHGLDMTRALRALCAWSDEGDLSTLASAMVQAATCEQAPPRAEAHERVTQWLGTYRAWRQAHPAPTPIDLRHTNPQFVLRNWITDVVAERLEQAHDTAYLEQVRAMCAQPFAACTTPETRALCEIGALVQDYMPSCSS